VTLPRILIGAEYLHAPTGARVVVVDHELRHLPRPPHQSARTGNLIIRPFNSFSACVVAPEDLSVLP
jgi:hypothetical protein